MIAISIRAIEFTIAFDDGCHGAWHILPSSLVDKIFAPSRLNCDLIRFLLANVVC